MLDSLQPDLQTSSLALCRAASEGGGGGGGAVGTHPERDRERGCDREGNGYREI